MKNILSSSCVRNDYLYQEPNDINDNDEVFDIVLEDNKDNNISSCGYLKNNNRCNTCITYTSTADNGSIDDFNDNINVSYYNEFNYKPTPIKNTIQIYKFYNSLLSDITNDYKFKHKYFNTDCISTFNDYIRDQYLKRLAFRFLRNNSIKKFRSDGKSNDIIYSTDESIVKSGSNEKLSDDGGDKMKSSDIIYSSDQSIQKSGDGTDEDVIKSSPIDTIIKSPPLSISKIIKSPTSNVNKLSSPPSINKVSSGKEMNLCITENESPRRTPITRMRRKGDINIQSSGRLLSLDSLLTSNNEKRKRCNLEYDFSFFKRKYIDKNEYSTPKVISERTRGVISHSNNNNNKCNRIKLLNDNKKQLSSSLEYINTRRCIISNNKTSSDSGKLIKKNNNKSGLFDTNNDESNWCSEMWNPYTNVITCKKLKIGHGSFSIVSIAILRLYNNNDNCILPIDDLLKEIMKYCNKCIDIRTMNCAIKSISDEYPQSRFQYIREKEMMLHFNSNVLKPLSCRSIVNNNKKYYQLLLPRAHGDLLGMLNKLILYRSNNTHINGLSENEVKYLFIQILSGITFIHMCFQGDIYRHSDVKLANILVFCDDDNKYKPLSWKLVLADFGCSILINPSQHLDSSSSFKGLYNTLSKEWTQQLSQQLSSYIRGTVRYNAPETLSYDRNGNRRSNHNYNTIRVHDKTCSNLLSAINVTKIGPKVWGNIDTTSIPNTLTKRNTSNRIDSPSEYDNTEYYRVDMRADMWSCGIILAELSKFGTVGEYVTCKFKNKNIDELKSKINLTLGRGLFCRNTSIIRKNLGKDSNVPITDDDLNKSLAVDIALICDVSTNDRINNIKKVYHSWELPKFTDSFWNLLGRLLSYKPSDRLIGIEALGHAWFNDCKDLFDMIDSLPCFTNNHLPINHFYSINNNIGANCLNADARIPHSIENSDLLSNTINDYSKVSQRPHAWYAGPLHYRLSVLDGDNVKIPDCVLNVCKREASVLENREKELFGARGAILSKILAIKSRDNLSWHEILSSHTTHLLGKEII